MEVNDQMIYKNFSNTYIIYYNYMAGNPQKKELLNKTLYYIVQLLTKYHMEKWFIAYGTLLGIVRNKSCIDNDDDVDIVCDRNDAEKLKQMFIENGFTISINKFNFFQLLKKNYTKVDFYCATVNGDDYSDTWENIFWKNASLHGKFIKKKWNNIYLQLPYQYITKLTKYYGKTWRIPIQNYKGTRKSRLINKVL